MVEATERDRATEVYDDIEKRCYKQLRKAMEACRQSGKPLLNVPLIPEDIRTSTFLLPSMEKKYDEFFDVDKDTEARLEEQLKWTPPGWTSPSTMKLRALENDRQNNCVFHAVSMALWGVNDNRQMLRKLADFALENHHNLLKNTYAKGKEKMATRGFFRHANDKEVNEEWDAICDSAKRDGISVDWFFLYILSNILRRPIVMHGKLKGKIEMRGIFLPSMIRPACCYKTPIVVGFTDGVLTNHLASLVGYEGVLSHVSLVDGSGKPLPVWYGVDGAREGFPCPETTLIEKYMRLTWGEGSDGKKYPLAAMGVMKMNAGNDAVMQTAKGIESLFEKKEEERTGSGVGDVLLEAKRKRESNEHDEVELSRPSKRTLPSSPSVSSDAALSVVAASPPAADVFALPSPSARGPRTLLEAQRQNVAFAEGDPETPDARRPKGRRLATACLAAATFFASTSILIARRNW